MMGRGLSLLDRLVGVCLTLLVGSAAVYVAVRLLAAVFVELLIIGGVLGVAGIVVMLIRARSRGW